jgi:hypothetical protein
MRTKFAVLLFVPALLFAQEGLTKFESFLQNYIHLSVYQMHQMQDGNVQAKILPTEDPAEVAVFGIVRVNSTRDAFMEKVHNITQFEKRKGVEQIGKFSDPPQSSDIEALKIDQEDLTAIGKCMPGNCDIQLSDVAMERLKTSVDISVLAKTMLVEYVTKYMQGGNEALSTYNDKKHPFVLAKEFDALLGNSKYIYEYTPELGEYLKSYPKGSLQGAENFLYWEKSRFHKKPVISLNHATLYQPEAEGAILATKMLYASHYFHAALDLTGVRSAAPKTGVYLISLKRVRISTVGGSWRYLQKQVVQNDMRDQTERDLTQIKKMLEKK